ncbi:YphA family membrane protein [Bacillus paramycoides]|uniref:YphA family membrane protein n=1 Tax=Bacillus paramycoides TaxID=2026194 RepID=UPI003CFFA048
MDGNSFYFVAWIGWIVVTFFMKKESIRWKLSAAILLFIICSPLNVTIASFAVSVNALLLCFISFVGIAQYSIWKKLYTLLSALIIAMLYTSFHLLEVYDPIWIVVDRLFLLSSALVYASVLLHRDRILRLCSLYIGMLQGELLVTLIFRKLNFPYDYGSLAFFDIVAVSTLFMAILFWIAKASVYMEQFKRKTRKRKTRVIHD